MSRKYAVDNDGRLISSNDIPFDWEVVKLSKKAVADVINQIEWESDPLLDLVISQDVMCVCEIVSLQDVSVDVPDPRTEQMLEDTLASADALAEQALIKELSNPALAA